MTVKAKVSLAVLFIDSFTNDVIPGHKLSVVAEGIYSPLVKPEGYHVFRNIQGEALTIQVRSKIYQPLSLTVGMNKPGEQPPVCVVRLLPNTGYPLPKGATVIQGQAPPNKTVLFYGKGLGLADFRLHQNYVTGSQTIGIFNPGAVCLEGMPMRIVGGKGTFLTIASVKDLFGHWYSLNVPLKDDYNAGTTWVFPVFSAMAHEDGTFYLPVASLGEPGEKMRCWYTIEGCDEAEREVELVIGSVNDVTIANASF